MTIQQLKELARHAARGTAPANYECENVNAALADGLKELCGSVNDFMRNKYDIYEIIIKNADEIVPKKVFDAFGAFAEIIQVPQGQKAIFKRGTLGKNRARKFLTQVGLSGVYETFRLDTSNFTLEGKAVGGAITMDFERFLDGAESLSELMDILTEGLSDAVFKEIQKALTAAYNDMGPANRYESNDFEGEEMQKLITTVKNYGQNVVIFACPEFIDAMGPDLVVPIAKAGVQGIYAPQDIERIHSVGRINLFRGTPIIEMPQSFVDETNDKVWIDPSCAYILPAGKEKVVKVMLEGETQMYDFVNRDQSVEVHAYKKMGAAIMHHHNWAIYKNLTLADDYEGKVADLYPNL